MKYSKPASADIPFDSIIPSEWGEEFDDNEEMNYCANYVDDCVFWVREHSGNIPLNFWEFMEGEDPTNEDNLQLDFVDL